MFQEIKIPTVPKVAEWHDVGVGDYQSMSLCSLQSHLQLWPKVICQRLLGEGQISSDPSYLKCNNSLKG